MFRVEGFFERGAAEAKDFKEEDSIFFAGFDIDAALSGAGFAVDEVDFAAFLSEEANAGLVFVEFEGDAVGVGLCILESCGGTAFINGDDSNAFEQRGSHGIGHCHWIAAETAWLGLDVGRDIEIFDGELNIDELSGFEFAVEHSGGGAHLDDDGAFAISDIDFGEVADWIEHGTSERLGGSDGIPGDASDDGVDIDEGVGFERRGAVPRSVTEVGAGDDGAGCNFGHGHWQCSAFAGGFFDGGGVVGEFHEVARCECADDAEDCNGQHPGGESHGCAPENLTAIGLGLWCLRQCWRSGLSAWVGGGWRGSFHDHRGAGVEVAISESEADEPEEIGCGTFHGNADVHMTDLAGVFGGLNGDGDIGGEIGAEDLGNSFAYGSSVFPGDAHVARAALCCGADAGVSGGEHGEFDECEKQQQEYGQHEHEFHGEHGSVATVL